jgi:hypothetical protein
MEDATRFSLGSHGCPKASWKVFVSLESVMAALRQMHLGGGRGSFGAVESYNTGSVVRLVITSS